MACFFCVLRVACGVLGEFSFFLSWFFFFCFLLFVVRCLSFAFFLSFLSVFSFRVSVVCGGEIVLAGRIGLDRIVFLYVRVLWLANLVD